MAKTLRVKKMQISTAEDLVSLEEFLSTIELVSISTTDGMVLIVYEE